MLFFLTLALVLVSLPGIAADTDAERPNILLITVDTLRADHLSSYGYHLQTSPNMDKLAADGARFENVNTVIPLTGPAHFSLFTSRYPQEHGARINGIANNENARILFLPQVLRRFGYKNAAFVSAWPLTSRLTHLDDWFDHYDEDLPRTYQLFNSQRYAEDVTPRAIIWLKENTHRPFFLWVHYFDPHSPYHLREGFENLKKLGPAKPLAKGLRNPDARERIRKYDSEIAYADQHIGQLLEEVDKLGLREQTLVALVADHGESLGEHGYVGHGRQLYEPIIRIPLIIRYPGKIAAGRVIQARVSLTDLTPTILDLSVKEEGKAVELPVPLQGRSLAASLTAEAEPDEHLTRYVTFGAKKGWMPKVLVDLFRDEDDLPLKMGRTSGDRKVIWTPDSTRLEIYDLATDPPERKPTKPKTGSPQYKAETNRLKNWFESTAGEAGENKMSEEDVEVLRSLGYIQ